MDAFTLDADPFIPTGVEATPDQVASMLADDILPIEAVANIAEHQRPDSDQLTAAAEASEKPTKDVLAKLAPLMPKPVKNRKA